MYPALTGGFFTTEPLMESYRRHTHREIQDTPSQREIQIEGKQKHRKTEISYKQQPQES